MYEMSNRNEDQSRKSKFNVGVPLSGNYTQYDIIV